MTTIASTTDVAAGDVSAGSSRIRVAAGALAASAATVAALLITKPWGERLASQADDFLVYDSLQAIREGAWWGLLVDGLALAVVGLAAGLCVLHLVHARGGIAAVVGAVLSTAGGILFAMGTSALVTFVWYATAPELADGTGPALIDFANDNRGRLLGLTMAGFLSYTLGTVVLAAAVLRARVLPVVAVVAFLVLTAASFVMPGGSAALDIFEILQMLLLVALALVVWRRA